MKAIRLALFIAYLSVHMSFLKCNFILKKLHFSLICVANFSFSHMNYFADVSVVTEIPAYRYNNLFDINLYSRSL